MHKFTMLATLAAATLAFGTAATAQTAAPAKKAMTYDCTKAGNKNKAACKTATPAAAPMAAAPAAMKPAAPAAMKPAAAATTTTKTINYDCTKAGNKNKAACKTATPAAAPMAAAPAPMAAAPAKPMAAARPVAASTSTTKTYKAGTVEATLKNGKVVHYDCTLAGNKTKKACQK